MKNNIIMKIYRQAGFVQTNKRIDSNIKIKIFFLIHANQRLIIKKFIES